MTERLIATEPLFSQEELDSMPLSEEGIPEFSRLIEEYVYDEGLGAHVDIHLTFENDYVKVISVG